MKKVVATIFVTIIAIAGAWQIINYVSNQMKNETIKVSVTQFAWTSSWATGPVGTLWGRNFNVTLLNQGTKNATELTAEVRLSADGIELWSQTWFNQEINGQTEFSPNATFNLYAGETREFRGWFTTRLDELERVQGETTFTVTVKLDDTIVDELKIT